MSRIIGSKSKPWGVYPTRGGAGGSGSSSLPYAQLRMSGNAAFVDDTSLLLPFNTIVSISSGFSGAFQTFSEQSVFGIPFGTYLISLQVDISAEPTLFRSDLSVISGSAGDAGGVGMPWSSIAYPVSAVRASSETPVAGGPAPCVVLPQIRVIGISGNVLAASTRMLIQQISGP